MKFITICQGGGYYNHIDKSFTTIKKCSKYRSLDEVKYYNKQLTNTYLKYYIHNYWNDSYDLITEEQFFCNHVYKAEKYEIVRHYNRIGKGSTFNSYHTVRHICIKCGFH